MSNLRLINETLTQSAFVNQISITDIFTTDFDIYKIVISNAGYDGASSDVVDMRARFINSSDSTVTSSYDTARLTMKAEAGFDNDKQTNIAYMYGSVLVGNYQNGGAVLYVFNPTNSSSYTFMLGQGASGYETSANRFRVAKQIGVLKQTSSITGINFVSSSASNDFKADIKVFGLRVDS